MSAQTPKEQESSVRYYQGRVCPISDVTHYVLYGLPLPQPVRFFPLIEVKKEASNGNH